MKHSVHLTSRCTTFLRPGNWVRLASTRTCDVFDEQFPCPDLGMVIMGMPWDGRQGVGWVSTFGPVGQNSASFAAPETVFHCQDVKLGAHHKNSSTASVS